MVETRGSTFTISLPHCCRKLEWTYDISNLKEPFYRCYGGGGGDKGVEVNLLQYTNDIIFVREMSTKNMVMVKTILQCFGLVSNLKVNFQKSWFRGIGWIWRILKYFLVT